MLYVKNDSLVRSEFLKFVLFDRWQMGAKGTASQVGDAWIGQSEKEGGSRSYEPACQQVER